MGHMRTSQDINKAREHAQANANFTGKPWVLFSDTSGNLNICRETQKPRDILETIHPAEVKA